MSILHIDPWPYFVILFTILLVTTLWMTALASRFRRQTKDLGDVPFSILDLQFPSSEAELYTLIRHLPPNARRALKAHLWVDYLFMAGLYPAIALLCLILGTKTGAGQYFFWLVAALQGFAWLFDAMENAWLLRKLRKPEPGSGKRAFRNYTFCVYAKFILAFLGVSVTLPVIFYFWMSGSFSLETLRYLGIVLAEIIVFILIARRMKVPRKNNISAPGSSTP